MDPSPNRMKMVVATQNLYHEPSLTSIPFLNCLMVSEHFLHVLANYSHFFCEGVETQKLRGQSTGFTHVGPLRHASKQTRHAGKKAR